MSSRKYFLSITAMMLVLFFMFMFSEIVKSSDRNYNDNSYAKVTPIIHKENEKDANALRVQFYGNNTILRSSVAEWCRYTKKNFVEDNAAVIVVDSKSLNQDSILELEKKADKGVVLIFAGFPDTALLEKNDTLRRLMGVKEVKKSIDIDGIRLFSGFLLGGEKQYMVKDENGKENDFYDFSKSVPFVVTGKGSKPYAVAVYSKVSGNNKENNVPALIWREVTDNSVAFVIYDDFIDNKLIHGVLESCVYESSDFTVCPVVNASVYSVADFALLAEENTEKIQEIYSRTTQSLVKEIIWPRIMSYAKRENIKFSCYFNTRLDRETTTILQTNFTFFLREMREIGAEVGISGNSINSSLNEKLTYDLTFYKGTGSDYEFTSLYLESLRAGDIAAMTNLNKMYSLNLMNKGNCDYIDATDKLLITAATQDMSTYSYKADFAYRSLNTALGYSNVMMDIKRVMRPESEADQWQNYSEFLSGNLSEFWTKLSVFDNVTASEAAVRTAAYLKNSAVCTKKGRTIILPGSEPGYFLLRTHGETISNIKNASFTYLEKGAYIIQVTNNEAVEITVE